MASIDFKIRDYIDLKFLLIGLGGVLGIYGLLFGYSFVAGASLIADLEARLAHKTVVIELAKMVVKDEEHHGEADALPALGDNGGHGGDSTPVAKVAKYEAIGAIDGLFEHTNIGNLPQIRQRDGLTPFDAYKKVFDSSMEGARIAVVLQDIGLSLSLSEQAIVDLPEGVSMILSPYAQNLKRWQGMISAHGHEMWLSVPAEDINYPMSEPGSQGVLSRSSYDYNKERLFWALSRIHGYAGVAMYVDEAFANAGDLISSLAGDVFERGLGYLELNPSFSSGVDVVAARSNAPYLVNSAGNRNALFDEVVDVLERNAAAGGVSVAVLPVTPVNLAAIGQWVKEVEDKGIVLVPLSAAFAPSSVSSFPSEAAIISEEPESAH